MSSGSAPTNSFEQMIPLLIEIQQNLDQNLDLRSLASKYGYSPFHFQRMQKRASTRTL
jgi:AraC-like DNA-binding protein